MKVFKTILAAVLLALFLPTAFGQQGPPVRMPEAPIEDIKSFTGAFCQPNGFFAAQYVAHVTPGIYNISGTEWIGIRCPILRDDALGTDGVMLFVSIKNNSDGRFYCYLYSFDINGSMVASDYASTSETGDRIIELEVTESAEYGFYEMYCGLPPNSFLKSYRLYEYQYGYDDMTDYDQ